MFSEPERQGSCWSSSVCSEAPPICMEIGKETLLRQRKGMGSIAHLEAKKRREKNSSHGDLLLSKARLHLEWIQGQTSIFHPFSLLIVLYYELRIELSGIWVFPS